MADPSTVRELLAATSVPADLVDEVLEAAPSWLVGADAEVVAAEVVLCHPPLADAEVRAVAAPAGAGTHRLTVVAADRPGLLAGTAGVLAAEGASVRDATTVVLPHRRLGLQRVEVGGDGLDDAAWERIGGRLRDVLGGGLEVTTGWRPSHPVTVETQPQGDGRLVLAVRAPDQPGLLHAAASWLAGQGCSIVSCSATSERGWASDVFVVDGDADPAAFAAVLGGGPTATGHGGFHVVRVAADAALFPWRVAAAAARAVGRADTAR
ncbi:MAG TPA: hypothetical protein VFP61_03865 [Acidimicrobiales bacterium]|nr:hypothetical protein [Acidimicrobiales bacterium]